MEPHSIMASTFKQHCLALLDQVERTKVPVIITKRGRPVAKLVPLEDDAAAVRPTMGSVQLLASEESAYYSAGDAWFVDGMPDSEAG